MDYEEVIEEDVKLTLREHYGYGTESIRQFWELEGEAITNKVYNAVSQVLADKAKSYEEIIGDIEL